MKIRDLKKAKKTIENKRFKKDKKQLKIKDLRKDKKQLKIRDFKKDKKTIENKMVLKGVSHRPDPTSVFKLHPDFRRSREVPNFVVADIMQKAHPSQESTCSTLKRPKVS